MANLQSLVRWLPPHKGTPMGREDGFYAGSALRLLASFFVRTSGALAAASRRCARWSIASIH